VQSWYFALQSFRFPIKNISKTVSMSDSRPTRAALRISPAPFKSSLLSIPPSPFSPRTPLTLVAPRRRSSSSSSSSSSCVNSYSSSPPRIDPMKYASAPANPLSWQWTCHQCAHSYPLSATRRCLDDGHRFCSGTTTVKAWRKPSGTRRVKKHRACSSEFDYSGWKAWIRWRRDLREDEFLQYRGVSRRQNVVGRKDCWNTCSYPSECRWGKRYGVHTPIESVFPSVDVLEISTSYSPSVQEPDTTPTLNRSIENIPIPVASTISPTRSQTSKDTAFWTSVLASAERRKSGKTHIASPLSVVIEEVSPPQSPPSSPPRTASSSPAPKDHDGDTTMTMWNIDPCLLTPTSILTSISPVSTPTTYTNTSPLHPTCLSSASPAESRNSPIMLRALWTRNKKTASTPLRYRRRNSTPKVNTGTGARTTSCCGSTTVPEASHAKRGAVGTSGGGEVDFEPEEFGVPLVRVGSRDSGYGSCV
ncbi:hypothetical protein T440DRAFT_401625, partial [Plenodomus tracheiphilus IPT5]